MALVSLASLLAIGPRSATAAILEVTLCTDTTPVSVPGELRHALINAGTQDAIILPPCTITLTGAANEDDNAGGDLDVIAKDLHLQGAGVGRTILDGGALDRVLDVQVSQVSVADLTLRNGQVSGASGGGLLIDGSQIVLSRVAVVDNRATGPSGGGIEATGSDVRLVESTVAGNRVEAFNAAGGGIQVTGSGLVLEGTTVTGNTANGFTTAAGGGLSASGTGLDVRQATVTGNRAEAKTAHGGGVASDHTTSVLLSTVVANVAVGTTASGGGVSASIGVLALQGTIVAGNTPENCAGLAVASVDHNLQDDASCPLTRLNDRSDADPLLGPLAQNGGLTATHLPSAGSPALDHGPSLGCPGTDQRGVTRPRDGDGDGAPACDVGAVERKGARAGRPGAPGKLVDPR